MMRRLRSSAVKLLRRDLGAGDLRVLALAVLIAVACAVSVTAFTDRLRAAIQNSGSDAIGADLVIRSSFKVDEFFEQRADHHGLRTAEFMTTRSVVVSDRSTALSQIKAVDGQYPLRGQLATADDIGEAEVVRASGPGTGQVWLDSRLAALLDVRRGDRVSVGAAKLAVDAILIREPDRGGAMFALAPRLMLNLEDLESTQLMQPGSIASWRLLVAGKADQLGAWRNDIESKLGDSDRLIDAGNQGPQMMLAVQRGERFLSLAALISVLLAGAAIARAAQHYAERQLDAAALMRSVGATSGEVAMVFGANLLLVALTASLVGAALGYLGQEVLARLLPALAADDLPAPSLMPVFYGVSLGVLTVIAFAVPALVRLWKVPPLRVLKRDLGSPAPGVLASYLAAFLLLLGFIFWIARDLTLGLYLLSGSLVTLALLATGALALVWLVRRMGANRGVSWRFGLASLSRHRGAVVAQTTALGVGVMAMLLLTFVRSDLLALWDARLDPNTPNHFLMGVKADQRDALVQFAAEQGLGQLNFATMTRARVKAINGKAISSEDFAEGFARRRVQRAANLSFRDLPGDDNHIVEGQWWAAGDPLDQVSIEIDYARDLGFKLGDTLTYSIGDQSFDLRVTSLRRVDWDSFKPNFWLLTPPGALAGVQPGYIASVYVDPANSTYLRSLVRAFPNITDIDVDAILRQVRGLLDQLNRAMKYLFLFTVAAGLLVLFSSVITSYRARRREIGILKTLGTGRAELTLGLIAEFAALGLIAGGTGAIAATVTGWLVGRFALRLDYLPDPWLWLVGLLGGAVVVALAGVLSARNTINTPSWVSLRNAND